MRLFMISTLCLFFLGCSMPLGPSHELLNKENLDPIVGGHEVSTGEFGSEFVVMLYSENELGEPSVCTGTFVSESAILTAAHCVNKNFAQMSVLYSDKPFVTSEVIRLTPTFVVTHPKYKKGQNDIALIFFAGGLPKGAKTATLATRPWLILRHQHIFALGYGRTEGLEEGTDFSQELGVLRGVNIPTNQTFGKIDGFYTQQTDHGVCFGDSGGPALIVDEKGLPIVAGVANAVISSANNVDFCKYKSAYLDVGFYIVWLNELLNLHR